MFSKDTAPFRISIWQRDSRIYPTVTIFLAVLLSAGCRGLSKEDRQAIRVVPTLEDIVRLFASDSVADSEELLFHPEPEGWQVYVDGSESMRGFAGYGAVRQDTIRPLYRDVIRAIGYLLSAKSGAGDTVSYYSFLMERTPRNAKWFAQDVMNPRTYAGSNDNARMFSHIAGLAGERPPRVALVITDGVHSTPDRSNQAIVEPLSRWLALGYDLGIIVIPSGFSGRVFSEVNPVHSIGSWRGARPLHIYVLASDPNGYNEVLEALSSRVGREKLHSLLFSRRTVRADSVSFRTIGKGSVVRPGMRNRRNPEVAHLRWRGGELEGPAKLGFSVRLTLDAQSDSLLGSDLRMRAISHGRMFYPESVRGRPSSLAAGVASTRVRSRGGHKRARRLDRPAARTEELEVGLDIKGFKETGRHTAMIELALEEAALQIPSWVARYSTDDDGQLSSYDRTFEFEQVVNFIKAPFAAQALCTVYVEVYKPGPRRK